VSYFESRLKADFGDFEDIREKLRICEELGIKNVILEPKDEKINVSLDLKEKIRKVSSINIYYRINLNLKSVEQFKRTIKKFNNFQEILSIESMNKEVQIHAARDSRVDILSFSDQNILKTLSQGIISLIKQNNSFVEFSLATIWDENRTQQSKNLRILFRNLQLAKKIQDNFIISGNFNKPFELRHPRALISICYSLLDLPLVDAKRAFKANPRLLIDKLEYRKDNSIIERGVKLIKGGGS